MGSTQSKESRPVKEISQTTAESRSKRLIIDRFTRLRNRGGKMDSCSDSRSNSEQLNTDDQEDTNMAPVEITGGSSRKSTSSTSRRRTRSMGISEQGDGEIDESEESVATRRIRRKMKGKSKEVSSDKEEVPGPQETSVQASALKEAAAVTMGSQTSNIPTKQNEMTGSSSASPLLQSDIALPSRNSDEASQTISPPILTHQTSATTSSTTSAFPLNPFELSGEERSSARARLARALSHGPAESTTREQATPTNDQHRPSMLSALLNDILGLRTSQMAAAAAAASASPSQAAASAEARQRTGGTSVIVQGALVSRTPPSHSATGSSDRHEVSGTAHGQSTNTSTEDSQIPSATLDPANALQEADGLMGHGNIEPQVATIEEQAAMLIRLLSIATAATAASITSRSNHPQQMALDTQQGVEPPRVPQSDEQTMPTHDRVDEDQNASNGIASIQLPTSEPAAASVPPSQYLSSSLMWRQASQPFQLLRSRFSALRSRIRFRNSPRPSETILQESTPLHQVNLTSVAEDQNNAPAAISETTGDALPAPLLSQPSSQNLSTGSLESLSSMLQEAIRRGVSRANGNTQGDGSNVENSSNEGNDGNNTHSIQATLNAVREGNLTRGEEGTFDRFLYDLMMDLDAAVRQMPRSEATEAADTLSIDDELTLRRRGDLREGQLNFFRLFTFPTIPAAVSNNNNLEQQSPPTPPNLVPCIVVGVRSLGGVGRALTSTRTTTGEIQNDSPNANLTSTTTLGDGINARPIDPSLSSANELGTETSVSNNTSLSRFFLFVSGGHYPPQHPLFHSSSEEAARDLMVLIEFLGAITTFQMKSSTVTKEEIEKSTLKEMTGGLEEINHLVKTNKVMENTSERCLICLEDWKEDDEKKRLLDCAHLFHAHCIDQWLMASNNSCPLCRRQAVNKKTSIPVETPQSSSGDAL